MKPTFSRSGAGAGAGAGAAAGAGAGVAAGLGSSFLPQPASAATATAAPSAACLIRERLARCFIGTPVVSDWMEEGTRRAQCPGWNGLPSEAGMLTRIHVGLREISTSTTIVAR